MLPDASLQDESTLSPGTPPRDEIPPLLGASPRVDSPVPQTASPSPVGYILPAEVQARLAILEDIPAPSKVIYEAVIRDASKWGAVWADCVVAFIEFEKTARFVLQDVRLPSLPSRPSRMGEWFKYGRKLSGQAWDGFCKGDANAFGERWRKWWSDLQPTSRHRDEHGIFLKDTVGVDWDCLRKPGGSGIFLVLVALVWWREMIEAQSLQPSGTKNWEDAVKDVVWVLGCLTDGWKPTDKDVGFPFKQLKRK